MNWIFENNINTDLITPGRYNITTDPMELARIVFIEYRPDFCEKAKKGDFIIAGNNFGCGSSRETAATAIKARGVKAVIAKSFSRIFYRNCLNQGLLAIISDASSFNENDILDLNLKKRILINKTQQKEISITIPDSMVILNKTGGIVPYIQKSGLDSINELFNIDSLSS